MRNLALVLAILVATLGHGDCSTCPENCNCFGWVGEWVADCARRDLTNVTFADFDPATTEIHMQYNNIEVLEPDTFANVPALKHLYLQSNKIAILPDGIFDNLPELQTLRLNNNGITDISSNKFENLKQLILLYIHNNDLKSVEANAFEGAEKLEQVSVANNPNLANIDINAFSGVENLTMIDISGSAVTSLQPRMFNRNDKLEKVYTYAINTLICNDNLWLYITWMNTHPRTAFGRATMVCAEPENLRGRSVLTIDPDRHLIDAGNCPDKCSCISSTGSVIIDCSSREFSAVPIGFPPETTEIFLQNNNIVSLRNNDFLHLSKLEYLHLHDNMIDFWDISAFTGGAPSLKQLTLQNNKLANIPLGIFNGMRSLEVFGIDNNNIQIVRPDVFSDMVSLVQFSMNDNQIRIIPADVFSNLVSLKYFGLANNMISSIPDTTFRNCPDLHFMDISGNELDVFPKVPPGVTRFVARDSRIMEISASSLEEADNLAVLDLSGNAIYVIENNAFARAQKLEQIDLSHNNIEAIDDATFASADKLTWLDISYNSNLISISDNAFFGQRNSLSRLYLNNGGLKTMSSKPLSIVETSEFSVTLTGNPWNCDCDLQDLAFYISSHSSTDNPTCAVPAAEEGKELTEVTYTSNCAEQVPEDENLALIVSLSVVGAVLIFCLVVGIIVWQSRKSRRKEAASEEATTAKKTSVSDGSNDVAFKNTAYDDNDEADGKKVPVSEL